jgi:putative endopeptidase
VAWLAAAVALFLLAPRQEPLRGVAKGAERRLLRACMDERRVAALGNRPLQPELRRLAAIATPRQLAVAVAGLHRYGIFVLFTYAPPPPHPRRLPVSALLAHVGRDFVLAGDTPAQASREARQALTLARALARPPAPAPPSAAPARPAYIPLLPAALRRLAPRFDWPAYFAALPPRPPGAHPGDPRRLERLNDLLGALPPSVWRPYLRWRWIHAVAAWLAPPFVSEEFRYAKLMEHIAGGQPGRRDLCASEAAQFSAHDVRAARIRAGDFFGDMLRLRAAQAAHQLW